MPPVIMPAAVRFGPSPGVANGRPDVFGSVALRVDHTPLDARWQRVEHAAVDGAAARFAEAQRGKDAVTKLEAVNWYVNKRVRFVDDQAGSGAAPTSGRRPATTLGRGRGDCEDYAIAKLQMLRRAGFADRDLYLVDRSRISCAAPTMRCWSSAPAAACRPRQRHRPAAR